MVTRLTITQVLHGCFLSIIYVNHFTNLDFYFGVIFATLAPD